MLTICGSKFNNKAKKKNKLILKLDLSDYCIKH